jgi:hypothetical protein
MSKRFTKLAATFAAFAALAVGGSAIATGATSKSHAPAKPAFAANVHVNQPKESEQPESAPGSTSASEAADSDGTAQAAACAAAGVNSDNVNYDEATGTCTVDAGADSNN